MLSVLANRVYGRLFAAQVVALTGTGLMTVALGLLAYELAGAEAGAVLGTALAIKMVAYVGVAPVVAGFADRLPRRGFLIAMDLVRAAVALALPFVDAVWQVYVLIFLLQSASAAFTPTFQATIPEVLPDEKDYTRALSLARLAYDTESLLSPAIAAMLLSVIGFHWLFAGTTAGFLLSAALVMTVVLPAPTTPPRQGGIYDKTTRGLRIYLATPRLRGLLALNLSVSAAGAMVLVNTVVLVRGLAGRGDDDVALAFACFGGASMLAALAMPRVLDLLSDRRVMSWAAVALGAILLGFAALLQAGVAPWPAMLVVWTLIGFAYSALQLPTGRLLRRSAGPADRPTLFAAQFALSHACWLITYPLAGWLGATVGMPGTLLVLGGVTILGLLLALFFWPAADPEIVPHTHPELPSDHPHLHPAGDAHHAHGFVIDDLHPRWPQKHAD